MALSDPCVTEGTVSPGRGRLAEKRGYGIRPGRERGRGNRARPAVLACKTIV